MPPPQWVSWGPTSQPLPRSHGIVQTYRRTHCTSAEMTLQGASALLSPWGGSPACLPCAWCCCRPAREVLLSPRCAASTSQAAMVDNEGNIMPTMEAQVWFSACRPLWGLPKLHGKDTVLQARIHWRGIIWLENPKLVSKRAQLWDFCAVKSITLLLF